MAENNIQSHKDLIVWQKSVELVINIYSVTDSFPKSELFGLTNQMRRASVSIPSNIAEGRRRSSRKDFRNFLSNAFGSGAELETQIEISKRLSFGKNIDFKVAEQLLSEIMRMLNRMISNLKD